MDIAYSTVLLSAGLFVGFAYLYRKINSMAKSGSCLFKIGYFLYTNTNIGHHYYRREVAKALQKYNNEPHTKTVPTTFNGLTIEPIALSMDNYSYLITEQQSGTVVLIDPADPDPVQRILDRDRLTPTAILTTHKHWDHSGGNKKWKRRYRNVPIYGSAIDSAPGINNELADGDKVNFGQLCFSVIHTPGHTTGHIVYVLSGAPYDAPDSLFSGDHLFLGGIGRMFEGLPATMLSSLDKITHLKDNTLVWPGHEYAKDNLEFGLHVDPLNGQIQQKYEWVLSQREQGLCTSPSTLAEEKSYNPFLRVHTQSILQSVGLSEQTDLEGDQLRAQALKLCRERKDKFKYKL